MAKHVKNVCGELALNARLLVSTLLVVFSFWAMPALSWWDEGHMVVAQIAYNHLEPGVKSQCDALITNAVPYGTAINSNFVTASVWADDAKFGLGTDIWHYIDTPFSLDGTSTNRVVLGSFDVVRAIRQCITNLQDLTQSQSNRAVSLRYLLHFVGDIHQPLHNSTAVSASHPTGDGGGNGFIVPVTNWGVLHAMWDAGGGFVPGNVARPLTVSGQTTISNIVAGLESLYPYSYSIAQIPDPADWSFEGFMISQTNCYLGITNNISPSSNYITNVQIISQARLSLAGQRLAKLLNTIFITNSPTVLSQSISGGNFTFALNTVTGRTYLVQWKSLLSDSWNDWTNKTALSNSISFSEKIGQTQRFYRAVIVN